MDQLSSPPSCHTFQGSHHTWTTTARILISAILFCSVCPPIPGTDNDNVYDTDVTSTVTVTTDTFMPTYPQGFFWSRMEIWHTWAMCRNLNSPTIPSWLWPRVQVPATNHLGHWQNCASNEQASINTCRLLRDDDKVSSRKGDSGAVLSSTSKKAFRSKRLWSERRLISTYIGIDQD